MEKLRLSLWDFFTFFMTGVFACLLLLAYLLLRTQASLSDVEGALSKMHAATTVAGFAIVATLIGMVVEPFANFFDRLLNRLMKGYVQNHKYGLDENDTAIRERLRNDLKDSDDLVVANPYFYAKDYVEQFQLAPNLITFLSRYGFYRNASLITLIAGTVMAITSTSLCGVVAYGVGTVLGVSAFKYRGDEFFGYMAPLVFRTALIHRLRSKKTPAEEKKNSEEEGSP